MPLTVYSKCTVITPLKKKSSKKCFLIMIHCLQANILYIWVDCFSLSFSQPQSTIILNSEADCYHLCVMPLVRLLLPSAPEPPCRTQALDHGPPALSRPEDLSVGKSLPLVFHLLPWFWLDWLVQYVGLWLFGHMFYTNTRLPLLIVSVL